MIINTKFLSVILLCWPFVSMADVDTSSIKNAKTIEKAGEAAKTLAKNNKATPAQNEKLEEIIAKAIKSEKECDPVKDNRSEEEKAAALKAKQDAYDEAKATEQSTANKTLTALTSAATGIGGMELAMGLAEQSADASAANSMAAYIATMRCTYANDKQVKVGPEEIELPGGNNQQLMNLRAEYFALANDLKERKSALGMQPGIESTEILDKAATGLYDDENIGITSGAYASLYRAQMLGSETDQAKIDEAAAASKRRVMGGAIAASAGAVVGIAGNMLINSDEIKEKIKQLKEKRDARKEQKALDKLKACLKSGGAANTESLMFNNFKPSILSLNKIDCNGQEWKNIINGRDAQSLFIDTNDDKATEKIIESFSNGDDVSIIEKLLK